MAEMAHIFDIMGIVCREIETFARRIKIVSTKIPDFLMIEANRAIDTIPGIKIDENKSILIERVTRSYAGGETTTVYTAVADNISEAIIDTFAILSKGKDREGKVINVAANAVGVIIPNTLFDENADPAEITKILRKLYLDLLNIDGYMHYSADPTMIRLKSSNKVRIPTYDIEMMLCAICYMYISLNTLIGMVDGTITNVASDYIFDAFTEKEIPQDDRKRISNIIMEKHCASCNALKDALSTGKLLKLFFM